MTRPNPLPSTLRRVVEAAVVVVPLTMWTGAVDAAQLPKAILVAAAALAVATVFWVHALRGRAVPIPPRPFLVAVSGFALLVVIAAFAAGGGWRGVVGVYSRWNGVAMVVACAVLALAASTMAAEVESLRRLHRALLVGLALVTGYGILQKAGLDPIAWVTPYEGAVFASLGNPNFLAAYLGIGTPLWAAVAADGRRSRAVRAGAVAGLVAGLVVIAWTGSLQGPLTAAVALAVFVFVLARRLSRRRLVRSGVAVGGGLAGLVGLAGLLGSGPLAGLDWSTLTIRFGYWRVALGVWAGSPLVGTGPTGYADHYRQHRTLEEWARVGSRATNDSAHNVLLDRLATGGLLVALAYMAVVAIVGLALVRAARRSPDRDLLVVAGLGGAWVGYMAQSMVSIDVPALMLVGWILAGALVALGWPATEPVPLRHHLNRRSGLAMVTGAAAMTLFLAVGGWALWRQFSADGAAHDAMSVLSADPPAAIALYEQAADAAPWEPRYRRGRGDAFDEAGRLPEALAAYEEAAAVDPWWWDPHIAAARLSAFLGDLERSAAWYERVLVIEPVAPDMKFEAGRVAFLAGRTDDALTLLEAAVRDDPGVADWWLVLADARGAAGDSDGSRAALERARALGADA